MNNTLFLQIFILVNAIALGAILTLAVQHGRAHNEQKKLANTPAPEQPEPVQFGQAIKEKIITEAEVSFHDILDKSVSSLEHDLTSTANKLRNQLEKFGHDAESEEAENYHKTIAELHDQAKSILGTAQNTIITHQAEITEKLAARQSELENALVTKITQIEEQLVARQAELQTELNERQAELEARLAKHHAELRTGFNERQEKIEAELVQHQTELESALKEREASLAKVQTELDASLAKRKQDLEAKLDEEMTKKRTFIVQQLDAKLTDAVTSFLLEALQHDVDLGAQTPLLTTLLEEHKAELLEVVSKDD